MPDSLDSDQVNADELTDAELDQLVAELDAGIRRLPIKAIEAARQHRAQVIPRLIQLLREATAGERAGRRYTGNAPFVAMFLLTEFNATESWPVILDSFSLPEASLEHLFGEAITETFSRILAKFSGDNPDQLDAMIVNQSLYLYVRWEAAQAYVHLVRDGKLGRDEAVERLRRSLRVAIDAEDGEMATCLISKLSDFAADEAWEEINEGFERDLVDPFDFDREFLELRMAEGEDGFRRTLENCPPTGIEDALEELRHWGSFSESVSKPAPKPVTQESTPTPPLNPSVSYAMNRLMSMPDASQAIRVGRNDPCPCGSGKKYKKCCLEKRA